MKKYRISNHTFAIALGMTLLYAPTALATEGIPIPIAPDEPNAVVRDENNTTHNLVVTPLLDASAPVINPLIDTAQASIYDSMGAVLAYSPSLRVIQENRIAQQYEVEKAYSGYYPSVDVTATYGVGYYDNVANRQAERLGTGQSPDFAQSATASATITQILWNGRAVANSVDYNLYVLESLDARVYDNATYLALEGLIAHVDVVRTIEVMKLTDEYVQTHRQILAQQEQLSFSGIMTEADVTQAQGRLISAIADQQNAVNAYQNAVNNYQQLTGQDLPAHLLPAQYPTQAILTAVESVETAMVLNPKIAAGQADYQASTEQVAIAEADYHPQVTLTFGSEYENPDLNATGNESQYTLDHSATVGMSWNLFNGFATQNTVLAAQARTRMAREETINIIDTVKTDIIATHNDLTNARALVGTYEEAMIYNLATRDNYLSQFSFGTRSLLDVLDAETELYNTQIQLLTARANTIINSWKILALEGTLLEELSIGTTYYQDPLPPNRFGFDD